MPYDVFISHSKEDKAIADAVCAKLETEKIRCWIAPRDISVGTDWADAIICGIESCRVMVLIFSAKANASPQVRREVQNAFEKGLTVVPFRIERVKPTRSLQYYMVHVHWLDALTEPMERHITRLVPIVKAITDASELSSTSRVELEKADFNGRTAPNFMPASDAVAKSGGGVTQTEHRQERVPTILEKDSVPFFDKIEPAKTSSGQIPSFLDQTRAAAEQGHADAQFSLGGWYRDGTGLTQDTAEAVKWFRQAAEQGNALAQTSLGACYQNGTGVMKDYTEAVRWYRKGADQGEPYAQNNLGVCYRDGIGVAKDTAQAEMWLRKAADQGMAVAVENLKRLAAPVQPAIHRYVKLEDLRHSTSSAPELRHSSSSASRRKQR